MISAAIATLALTAAAAVLGRTGRRSPALLLPAMTPMAVFMTGAVNPTSIEITGTLLLWCWLTVLHVHRAATIRHLLVASTIAAVVTLVRPVALPWIAVAFAAFWFVDRRPVAGGPARHAPHDRSRRDPARRRRARMGRVEPVPRASG